MNRYIGQVVQDDRWVAFGIEADNIYDAEDYVKTIPSEGGRCTSLALTSDEKEWIREEEVMRH